MLKKINCLLIVIAMTGMFGLNTLSAEAPTLKEESEDDAAAFFEWIDKNFIDINAAISPTGKWVASSTQKLGQFILWNVKTGKKEKIVKLQNPNAEILDLEFSANSRILVIRELDKSKIKNKCKYSVWNISQPKIAFLYSVSPQWKYSEFTSEYDCFACSPDSKELACSINMEEFHVLELSTGRVIRKIRSNWTHAPHALFYSTDNQKAAGNRKDKFLIWERKSGRPLLSINYQLGYSKELRANFERNQKQAFKEGLLPPRLGIEDEMRWTWKNYKKKSELKFNKRVNTDSQSQGALMSSDLSKLVCWRGSAVLIYEVETGKFLREFEREDDVFTRIMFSLDEKTIVMETKNDNIIRQFDIKTGKLLGMFKEHLIKTNKFSCTKNFSFSQDGTKLLCWTEESFRVWDVKTQKQIMCKQVVNRTKLLESMKKLNNSNVE